MNPQRSHAKDFFLNLGATVSLYTVVFSLLNLLFTIINNAYPKITSGYQYFGTQSISWPVSILVIFFPIFIFLMWLIAKDYSVDPERKNSGIHKWLTYLTLFLAGAVVAGDLITVLYYFIDGQELTAGFLLKVLALLVVVGSVFTYYISDIKNTLTPSKRLYWRIFAAVVVLGSIVWGFTVLGSPHTQRLHKYDSQKINDLSSMRGALESYYSENQNLPTTLDELGEQYYYVSKTDSQTGEEYRYTKTGDLKYQLCATFNKATDERTERSQVYMYGGLSWSHPEGEHCFDLTINPNLYAKPVFPR